MEAKERESRVWNLANKLKQIINELTFINTCYELVDKLLHFILDNT